MLFEMFFKHEHSWSFLLNKVILFHQKKKKKKNDKETRNVDECENGRVFL